MKCFKALGCCFNLDESWTTNEQMIEELKPYVYTSFKKDEKCLYLLNYGTYDMSLVERYLTKIYEREDKSHKQTKFINISSRMLNDFEQKYFEVLYYDEEKEIYNLRIFTTFSKQYFVFGCIDCYFEDYEDLNEMRAIFYEKFKFIGESK